MTDFGKLLKIIRTNSHLTQKELSQLINISDKVISKWERGESYPDIHTIRSLSHVFHVSCDDLLHPTKTLSKMHISHVNSINVDEDVETSEKTTTDTVTENATPPLIHFTF